MRYAEGRVRGYIKVTAGPGEAVAELRGVDDVHKRDSGLSAVARFTVENGRPGALVS